LHKALPVISNVKKNHMKLNFIFDRINFRKSKPEKAILNFQQKIISVSETRLNKKLSKRTINKIETKYLSFIGLEMILDTVESIELEKLENYLKEI
jgi:hypothetical protein